MKRKTTTNHAPPSLWKRPSAEPERKTALNKWAEAEADRLAAVGAREREAERQADIREAQLEAERQQAEITTRKKEAPPQP